MMKPLDILFVHNNFPAQFRHLAQRFQGLPGVRVRAIATHFAPGVSGIDMARYAIPAAGRSTVHPFAQKFDLECRRAEVVLYEALQLKQDGFDPALIYVHPGWGEALPLRTVFPEATLCSFAEFYYAPRGTDVGFDTEFDQFGVDGEVRIALRNASMLLALTESTFSIAPTKWQQTVFPPEFRHKIHVVHDGLDMDQLSVLPTPRALAFEGLKIDAEDEVITFVSRNLEPYRGFHVFMRALPHLLKRRPKARVLLVGGDGVSYGAPPRNHASWRNVLLEELGGSLDFSRVHFMGKVEYQTYLSVLRRSDVHVYLTYPFVLSWSMLEAMALECLVVGSDTPPVAEVITDRENGLLVPFFDHDRLVDTVEAALAEPEKYRPLRKAARQTILDRYRFEVSSWPVHVDLLREFCPEARLVDLAAEDLAREDLAAGDFAKGLAG